MSGQYVAIDGNEAAAHVAYRTNEVIAIYPITPASTMGELADEWRSKGLFNIWGSLPHVVEMQSEGGAAGAVHGALQAGSLTTTFTASQGLLLMIPNMYKIAGELTSTVFHIAARALAGQALSIFGDHSDVMAARATGWAMLFGNSVQEAMDFGLIAQAATLRSRVPFLHIFDGFRTSHEIQKIEMLTDARIRALIDDDLVRQHRGRALSPDNPFIRGTAQNPDVFFQARETANPFYNAVPGIVEMTMDRFAEMTGRRYRLFEYVGSPDAERVIVMMGSGCETVEETIDYLTARGEKVGLVKVRLFRPFSVPHLMAALPSTTQAIAVLDRTKEPGSAGEPLYQDVATAIMESLGSDSAPFEGFPRLIGGRYGLASKEFTPAMVKAVFDELGRTHPKNHFTIGIRDDVTHTSLDFDPAFSTEAEDVTRAVFWGLGADGTVGANKNTIKIICEETEAFGQGYFVYDSKKSGATTISHLRFGPRPIRSTYLIDCADFVAVHQFNFMDRFDTLAGARRGATLLLNSPYAPDAVWDRLPNEVQRQIVEKEIAFFVIDAYQVARENGLGGRINTIMQTCFFALSEVLPREEALARIKASIEKTYGKRGKDVVVQNFAAVDAAVAHLHRVPVPEASGSGYERRPIVPAGAPDFVRDVTATIMAGRGDSLPVSAMPVDGTYPSATTRWEKRNLALEVPVWDADLCIQCGKCVMVCPHAAIRAKVVGSAALEDAPDGFLTADARWRELPDHQYTLQVAVEDCTACTLCVDICPVTDKERADHKALDMVPIEPVRDAGVRNWDFFLQLPDLQRNGETPLRFTKSKDVQLLEPLFEFSGACAGCGETPYLALLTRMFGDRIMVANATGCSSIFGGNLPTTPWSVNSQGRGPAWSNSLFEDNAEFGLGMRLAVERQRGYARELIERLSGKIGQGLTQCLLEADQSSPEGIEAQRGHVRELKKRLSARRDAASRDLMSLADTLVERSVWIVGGDGWAYDIGYGGLDHVLASGENVNILVLDTEVYSNTGGQASKATGLGAVAKFAAAGKQMPKKNLGLIATEYGYVYVAQVALGADDNHVVKAFTEAQAYDGPSIIIAYGHCIAHGIDMADGLRQQKRAVESGYWPLYRFDPRRSADGKNPFQLDSRPPSIPFREYAYGEMRYRGLEETNPEAATILLAAAEEAVRKLWLKLTALTGTHPSNGAAAGPPKKAPTLPPGSPMGVSRPIRPPSE
jgi:pyruvate-ferredoxin/flavodoxin oxidoreductase